MVTLNDQLMLTNDLRPPDRINPRSTRWRWTRPVNGGESPEGFTLIRALLIGDERLPAGNSLLIRTSIAYSLLEGDVYFLSSCVYAPRPNITLLGIRMGPSAPMAGRPDLNLAVRPNQLRNG